jgi:hypothetical protein
MGAINGDRTRGDRAMTDQESQDVIEAVEDAFRNARENGYEITGDTFEEIADHMRLIDADVEIFARDQVAAAIEHVVSSY